jgi:hypothetical protein
VSDESIWSAPFVIAFPVALIDDANTLAELFGVDSGEDRTFRADRTARAMDGDPPVLTEFVWTKTPVYRAHLALVWARNPVDWKAALDACAARKGVPALSRQQIEALCARARIGDDALLVGDGEAGE